jgi:AraC-like DNA-binding protein
MYRFVSQLQVLAGQISDSDPATLIKRFSCLADAIPRCASRVEQIVVGNLLYEALRRVYRALEHDVGQLDPYQLDARRFRDALERLRTKQVRHRERRIDEFLCVLKLRYTEPELSAASVAKGMRVSPWHLARLLKRHTDHGFLWHLHSTRIARAKLLLDDSRWTIKEIAAFAGYGSASEFGRHFRAALGLTASQYRSSIQRHRIGDVASA